MPPKKNLPSKPESPADYAEFLRGINLAALALQECHAKIDLEAYFNLLGKKNSERRISTGYKLIESEEHYFNTTATFNLTVGPMRKGSPVLSIECTYEAHFHCIKPLYRDFAQQFADSQLRLVIWPYFRQLVNDVTSRMAIPPILIPFGTADS